MASNPWAQVFHAKQAVWRDQFETVTLWVGLQGFVRKIGYDTIRYDTVRYGLGLFTCSQKLTQW